MTRKYTQLTSAQCIEASAQVASGTPIVQVAQTLGVSRDGLRQRLIRDGLYVPCPTPRAGQQMPADEARAALALYLSGMCVTSISKVVGRHRNTILKALMKCPEYSPPVRKPKTHRFSGRAVASPWDQDLSTRMLMTMRPTA